jgi:hypothetical protein
MKKIKLMFQNLKNNNIIQISEIKQIQNSIFLINKKSEIQE